DSVEGTASRRSGCARKPGQCSQSSQCRTPCAVARLVLHGRHTLDPCEENVLSPTADATALHQSRPALGLQSCNLTRTAAFDVSPVRKSREHVAEGEHRCTHSVARKSSNRVEERTTRIAFAEAPGYFCCLLDGSASGQQIASRQRIEGNGRP